MNELHTYICSFCKTVANSTIKMGRATGLLRCVFCRRFMRYQHSSALTAAEWTRRNRQPVEFKSPHPGPIEPYTKRSCHTCHAHVEPGLLIRIPCVGKFCSEDCAQAGVLKHQQFMERLDKLKEDMPWLTFPQKTA